MTDQLGITVIKKTVYQIKQSFVCIYLNPLPQAGYDPRASAQNETQTAPSRIWNRFADSISYAGNHNTLCASQSLLNSNREKWFISNIC